jgi:hypothetical protein
VGAALQEPVEDGLCEIWIMEHLAERRQGLVRGNEGGAALQVADADDAEEHVGGVGGVALVAELVDDEDVRVYVGFERVLQRPSRAARESAPIISSAEVKRASKPFWIAR